jgi:hypothetical protein
MEPLKKLTNVTLDDIKVFEKSGLAVSGTRDQFSVHITLRLQENY